MFLLSRHVTARLGGTIRSLSRLSHQKMCFQLESTVQSYAWHQRLQMLPNHEVMCTSVWSLYIRFAPTFITLWFPPCLVNELFPRCTHYTGFVFILLLKIERTLHVLISAKSDKWQYWTNADLISNYGKTQAAKSTFFTLSGVEIGVVSIYGFLFITVMQK